VIVSDQDPQLHGFPPCANAATTPGARPFIPIACLTLCVAKKFVLAYRIHRSHQIPAGVGLYDVPFGVCLKSLTHHLQRIMLRDNQNFRFRHILADKTAGVQPVHPGHAQVKNYHIRAQAIGLFHGFDSVFGLVHNFPVSMATKQSPYSVPDYGMIVHH